MNNRSEQNAETNLLQQTIEDPLRRSLLAALPILPFLGSRAFAEEIIDLNWSDLLPEGETTIPNELRGLIQHDDAPLLSQQPPSSDVRGDWNGKIVRLPGFIVPIDYSGTGVVAFILVPFVGACVHVPPPPANQLVFVTTQTPYENDGLFEAVSVVGMFGVSSLSTQLAEIGYALSADKIEPYRA
ncbi:DUF3299 domain-containing protein [Sulfitobacter sp. SK012]|uniref:DUF3299 domain-containing protein n=1 Tax=Sulfitobacter sp. SK012 TaxID=1389005 RepID=UPI000E0C3A15|nr:DUF3299 domain-containing protein [Sulfitobacter sp. SK012]AXI46298.1 DUF3299 domain-containing protein [Sulfitobacter sp. SK012]